MSVKTRQELRDYANSNINTNGVQGITGAALNKMEIDEIDSFAMITDVGLDEKVKYNDIDLVEGYIDTKIKAGTGILLASAAIDPVTGGALLISLDSSKVWHPVYKYAKTENIVVTTVQPNWQEVGRLVVGSVTDAVYEYKFSTTYQYDTASRSAYFRFSTDGGITWNEFISEPSDSTNQIPQTYFYPKPVTAGVHPDIIVEMAKESGANTLTLKFLDIILQQVT